VRSETDPQPRPVTSNDQVEAAASDLLADGWCDVVGRGRVGSALSSALEAAGVHVRGPLWRGADAEGAGIVLLCVPDREIGAACAALAPGAVVGHTSASAPLDLLQPHERFVMHPLLSVTGADAMFVNAASAIDGSTPYAIAIARQLAERIGMRPRTIPAEQRALYHAAASAASNYLTTVEGMAERLGAMVGLDRSDLMPLVNSAVEHWRDGGARAALTGPVARSDDETVERQRAAVAESAPDLLPLWDALTTATRELARSTPPQQ
jgi:predicted short-subunit dehydrogenase-like oxidoreductase (DUF2520 family)